VSNVDVDDGDDGRQRRLPRLRLNDEDLNDDDDGDGGR
jgi:hypothetical protein